VKGETPLEMAKPRSGILGILGCTKTKIWKDKDDHIAGPTPAKEAYLGKKFINDRNIVSEHCDRWVILSAYHGFMDPDFPVPEYYDVTFSRPKNSENDYVEVDELIKQIRAMGLDSFKTIRLFSSCVWDYEKRIREAFREFGPTFEKVP